MQAAHRVAKNTGILYARMAITVFISLYATRLVLAALGVADFGLFNVVGGVIAMLGFLNSSMAAATQRFMSYAQGAGDLEKVKRIFNMSTLLHAGIAVVMVLVLEIAGYFFFNGILNIAPDRLEVAKIIYHFMVVSTFFTVLSVPYEAVITSHENMLFYAILGIIESVLKLGIAFYITYSALDHLVMYGLLMAALSVFSLILRRIYCHRYYAECVLNFRKYYEKSLMKEISNFAGWSLLGSASSMIANYGQGIVINVFFGTLVNAAQSVAAQISGQLGVFSLTLSKALNPLIDKSEGAGNRAMMLKATLGGTKISFFLLSFLYIPFLIKMPYILGLWLKNVPEFTVVFCRLLLIRNLIEQLYIPLTNALGAVGNIKKFQMVSSFLNIIPIIVSYVFFYIGLPPYTLYIAFILFSLMMLFNVIYFAKMNCDLQVSKFFKEIVFNCFVVFLLALLVSTIPILIISNEFLQFVFVCVVGGVSYTLFIWMFALSAVEKILVLNLKKNIIVQVNNLLKK
ncbi:MATE family efflux transporter [Flavobacterium sp. Arc2]|uniref:MATE family efflux transporter n=1 Tax=Flavobacterium sp. Arc2 TaxID=3046685 RepID=UPI00352CC49B